jgi:hypothetical protein
MVMLRECAENMHVSTGNVDVRMNFSPARIEAACTPSPRNAIPPKATKFQRGSGEIFAGLSGGDLSG